MAETTTMTIRLNTDVKNKLGRLAEHTKRSNSFLASEAVSAYVDRELEIVEGILRGLEDVKAGRVIPHEQVEREFEAVIAAAMAKAKGK